MPRSYSFDHFTVPKTLAQQSRSMRRRDKQQFAQMRGGGRKKDEGIHYGRNHAETEELLTVRTMNAQLEALAGLQPEAPRPNTQARMAPTMVPGPGRGQPIGALPVPEEPLPRNALKDVVDEARRHLRALQVGIQDVTQATGRLLSLPMEVARLAAQRLRFVHG
jgi:hypothetical protein